MPAQAGDYGGDMLVRVQGTYVNFNDESSCRGLGGLELDDEFIPTLTLTYFLNKNLAVELFCCFANLEQIAGAGAMSQTSGFSRRL